MEKTRGREEGELRKISKHKLETVEESRNRRMTTKLMGKYKNRPSRRKKRSKKINKTRKRRK